ncbi:MAG: HAMP domain-containing sensor histidine kinase [Deltaproteobacteria bacterium]|nr:HAMP domain-containing sensor histidine kinase [Deltaproteobacteria bacterium]
MNFIGKDYDFEELAFRWANLIAEPSSSPEHLYKNLLIFITETAHSEGGALILKRGDDFQVCHYLGGNHFVFDAKQYRTLLAWLVKQRKPLLRQEVLNQPQFGSIKREAIHFFLHFQAEACVPIFGKENLLGFFLLQSKKSGRAYAKSCFRFLEWIAAQSSLLFQNLLFAEQLRRQTAVLGEIEDLKTQICANLSHELRTPLSSITGFAELLAEEIDGPLNEEQKKHVTKILEGSEGLLKILTAFVDMARLESGQYPLKISQFSLKPLVDQVAQALSLGAETSVVNRISPEMPMVYGDVSLVQQVLLNILDNAAKYTPRGIIEVEASRKGEMLEICVTDTGIGIAPNLLNNIFDSFYQVSKGLARDDFGTGMGLSWAKKLVETHGGHLWAKSQIGRGSRFYFTLPLKPVTIKYRELAA